MKQPTDANRYAGIDYANCLWYSARNRGFYPIQNRVARSTSSKTEHQLWMQFVASGGHDDCGLEPIERVSLVNALADTVTIADQYFLAGQ